MTPETKEQALPQMPSYKPEAPVFGAPTGKKPKQKSPMATVLPNPSPSAANAGVSLGGAN